MDGFVVYNLGMTAVCAVFGGLVTYYAIRAARRTGQRSLWLLALGIGFVTIGSVATGGLPILVDIGATLWMGVVSTLLAVGFVILSYSLYTREATPGE